VNDQPLQDTRLRVLAQLLGAEAAERLDVERTAQAVVRRLRDQPRAVRIRLLPAWLPVAATIAVVLGGGGLVWRSLRPNGSAPVLAPAGLDLNNLSADELREVLNAVDQPLDVAPAGSAETGLDDLTPRELRRLLRALEG
jgi:hypothetical protein